MPNLRSLVALLCVAVFAPLAHAQFTGNFALTPPVTQINMSSASAGNWTYSASGSGTTSNVFDTTGAPASFVLFSLAVDLTGSASGTVSILSLQAGTLSFDYNLSINDDGSLTPAQTSFTYALNSNSTTLSASGSSTVFWNVEPGDTISFNTTAQGGQDFIFIPPPGPGIIPTPASGSASVTISNFAFTAVPEPGTYAVLFGLFSFGAVVIKKKRAQSA